MTIEDEVKMLLAEDKADIAIGILEKYPETEQDEALLLQLGELYYAGGRIIDALNKFNAVVRINPDNRKAVNYATMIRGILDYYNKDLLNP